MTEPTIHSVFDPVTQRHVMNEIQQPASPFEWRRYVIEEAIRRGDYVGPVSTKPKRVYKPRSKAVDYVAQGDTVK